MARKFLVVSVLLVCASVAQPLWAQRGGGGGGNGGGHCSGGQSSSNAASAGASYSQNPMASYSQNPMASQYALQQMQQQQYAQHAMAMRQMMTQLQMENQNLRAQLMQVQGKKQFAQVNSPLNAQGDSQTLLVSKKNSAATAKKNTSSKTRTVAQRDKPKAEVQKLALDELK